MKPGLIEESVHLFTDFSKHVENFQNELLEQHSNLSTLLCVIHLMFGLDTLTASVPVKKLTVNSFKVVI